MHHTSDHSLQVQGANGHTSEPTSLMITASELNSRTMQVNFDLMPPHCKSWSHQLSYRWGYQTLHCQQGCPHMLGSIGMRPVEMPTLALQAMNYMYCAYPCPSPMEPLGLLHTTCPSLHVESTYGPGTNEVSSVTASGQYHWNLIVPHCTCG